MKNTKAFYVIIIVLSTVLLSGIISGISIFTTRGILRESAEEILQLQCQKLTLEFDSLLQRLEQSVNTIAAEAQYNVDDLARFSEDREYVEAYTKELRNLMLDAAKNTNGVMSVYVRYNPELTDSRAGSFLTLDEASGEYVDTPTTDLLSPNGENMIWYEKPVENAAPTWIGPYPNYNVGYDMISYVVPYYVEGQLVGIVGMDIDYKYIKELFSDIHLYDTGYAMLLAEDGQVVAHKNFALYEYMEFEQKERLNELLRDESAHGLYRLEELDCTIAYAITKNHMLLGTLVPDREVYESSYHLSRQLALVAVVALAAVTVLATVIVRRLFLLSETDELTKIYNRKFFISYCGNMDKEKFSEYAMFLFDIDFFKKINDNFGHNNGDYVLKEISSIAKKLLVGKGIVARWGGDEFIGLLPKEDAASLLEQLRSQVETFAWPDQMPVTISIGYTQISPVLLLTEITDRADKALYQSKNTGKNRITAYSSELSDEATYVKRSENS